MALAKVDNVVLIGMPGVGKSTLGVLLAKATSRNFVDTDVLIQARERRGLPEILATEGREGFRRIEEAAVVALDCRDTVIATGGSVVYGERAMAHLKNRGTVVHLELPLAQLKQRLRDLKVRGVVMAEGQTLDDLFAERAPLYQRHADLTVDCSGATHEEVVDRLVAALAVARGQVR
jgi:shikimate kinase